MDVDNCSDCLVEKKPLSFLDENRSHAVLYIAMTFLALSVGIVGNVIIVGCFYISKALNKVGNEFLLNMALSDLCVTGVAEPICILGKFRALMLIGLAQIWLNFTYQTH